MRRLPGGDGLASGRELTELTGAQDRGHAGLSLHAGQPPAWPIVRRARESPGIRFGNIGLVRRLQVGTFRLGNSGWQSFVLPDCSGPFTVMKGYCWNSVIKQLAISRSIMVDKMPSACNMQVLLAYCTLGGLETNNAARHFRQCFEIEPAACRIL